MTYDAIVLHSGGMDSSESSSAAKKFGKENVVSLGIRYNQRHQGELIAAEKIAAHYGVRREVIEVPPATRLGGLQPHLPFIIYRFFVSMS